MAERVARALRCRAIIVGRMSSRPPSLLDVFSRMLPGTPSKWTRRYVEQVIDRCNKRIQVLRDRIGGVTQGRVMPDLDQVTIGSGKQFNLAVLFLDICGFSSRANWTAEEQKIVLATMDIFMAEMLNIVRDFGGTFEKNTGDGLMAYFGEGAATDTDRVKPAVEAAVVMHYVNDHLLTPWFQGQRVEPIRFRIGIDLGPVTVARVGLRGTESSIVAIGTSANVACKLMNLIPNGGICIGNSVYRSLPHNWSQACRQCDEPTGFVYVASQAPYPAWELNQRLSPPVV
ncbi:MAG: adenylate/guanylate cyclase domain-containing protein [bacterium]